MDVKIYYITFVRNILKFHSCIHANPGWVIFGCLIFAGLISSGFLVLESETDQDNLWIPLDSDFNRNKEWLSKILPSNMRPLQFMLVTENESNILTKSNLELMNDIMKNISNLR